MSIAALAIVMAGALAGIALVLNHAYARVALVELTLNEGLPPGHETHTAPARVTATVADPVSMLGVGIHVFLSRNCHACQRLIDELDRDDIVEADRPIHLHYVDRPRPVARSAADKLGATLAEHQFELAASLGADPLPYTIAVGDHDLVGRSVTSTLQQLTVTARDAGIRVT